MYKLAIYGKGGIGKSTTACNVAAALAERGHTVMQIGCDPKADSTKLHLGGAAPETVLDRMREQERAASGSEAPAPVAGIGFGGVAAPAPAAPTTGVGFAPAAPLAPSASVIPSPSAQAFAPIALDDIVRRAPDGVLCVEAGGPVPGVGCAGRGIIAAFDLLERLHAFETYRPDFVLYDVLGDVVCGGFAMPLRGRYADEVAIVTSGEMMALYAASNIMRALDTFKRRGYAQLLGLIANLRNVEDEREKIDTFCTEEGTRVLATVPRSPFVQRAEDAGKTVIEAFPCSDQAHVYRRIAELLEDRAQQRARTEATAV